MAVTVMVCVRLCVVVSWAGVAVGDGEQVNGEPRDVKHKRERSQPAGCGTELVRQRVHESKPRVQLAGCKVKSSERATRHGSAPEWGARHSNVEPGSLIPPPDIGMSSCSCGEPVATCIAVPRVALVSGVQRVKTVIALLLLTLWLPCTMHCQAEALGWLGSDSTCCEKGHADESRKPDCSDCAACSSVESGGYWHPQKAAFVHLLLAVALHLAPDTLDPIRESAALTAPCARQRAAVALSELELPLPPRGRRLSSPIKPS